MTSPYLKKEKRWGMNSEKTVPRDEESNPINETAGSIQRSKAWPSIAQGPKMKSKRLLGGWGVPFPGGNGSNRNQQKNGKE